MLTSYLRPSFFTCSITISCLLLLVSTANAQINGFTGQVLETIPPDREFSTSDEHYQYLLDKANGGTRHTWETLPRWDGLWYTSGNNSMDAFIDGGLRGGTVREGVLTPAYEAAYKERWRQQQEEGQVRYDRLTHCEPTGMPRWLLEPYNHEFINTPDQSWLINDFANSIRRVYINKEHANLAEMNGGHSWFGDSIGFWDGNKLIIHTKFLRPADFTRWSPMTSNQLELVETWEFKEFDDFPRLVVQVTMYDEHAFVKPLNFVYAFRQATDLDEIGYRIQHWECEQSSNSYLDENGFTDFYLP
ncbi:MAG: hypothetical protein P8J44_05225, partial [Gammaproteobacteria bacterium]|nr:hypothetical protein [Gammaproteobacteria bacterium]